LETQSWKNHPSRLDKRGIPHLPHLKWGGQRVVDFNFVHIIKMKKYKKLFGRFPQIVYICIMKQKPVQGIYCIENIINNKKYIGSSKSCWRRVKEHFTDLRGNKHKCVYLQNAFNKYGEDKFIFSIVEVVEDLSILIPREDYWTLFHDTLNRDKGYNTRLPSKNSSMKHLKSMKIGTEGMLLRLGPPNLKKISTEEWIQRRIEDPNFTIDDLPKVYIDKESINESLRKQVYRIDPITFQVLETIPSLSQVSKIYAVPDTRISLVLKHNGSKPFKFYKIKGHIFLREEDYTIPLLRVKPIIIKEPISYCDRDLGRKEIVLIKNDEIISFPSRTLAAKFLEVKKSRVYELIKGVRNKGNGQLQKIDNIKGWKIK
jgi:group I intron endonuclease